MKSTVSICLSQVKKGVAFSFVAGLFFSLLPGCGSSNLEKDGSLPRAKASDAFEQGMQDYFKSVEETKTNMHSIMVVKDGKVVAERWMNGGAPDKQHMLYSVSKSFTSTAMGFVVSEGLAKVTDKVISFFPDKLPAEVSENLQKMTIKDLLTMNSGHDSGLMDVRNDSIDWVKAFLAAPVVHVPGTYYVYNSMATYMVSAIVQKLTGMKVIDYLRPRLFEPLGIENPVWEESPQGINCGGWGLQLKTEDLAKMGLFYLQKGKWNGKQLLPAKWIDEATSAQVPSVPSTMRPEEAKNIDPAVNDWVHGYGYQFWRCRFNCYRADGAYGQYIIVIPEKNSVVVTTAHVGNMQDEINLIWKHILPVL